MIYYPATKVSDISCCPDCGHVQKLSQHHCDYCMFNNEEFESFSWEVAVRRRLLEREREVWLVMMANSKTPVDYATISYISVDYAHKGGYGGPSYSEAAFSVRMAYEFLKERAKITQ